MTNAIFTREELEHLISDERILEDRRVLYELRAAPPEIHLPSEPDERDALETWLSERAGARVRILVPQRGEKRGLVDLATRNAALAYQIRFNQATAAQYDALETLQAVLALPTLPRRIECFDISTIQGSETVASMVVCEDGRMRRGEYRKYRIRRDSGLGIRDSTAKSQIPNPESRQNESRQDDFAAIHEVVLRCRRSWRIWSPSASRKKRSCCTHAIAWIRSRSRRAIRRCCSLSASATKRTASPSRFIGGRGRCAIFGRSWTTYRASVPAGGERC